MRALACVAMLIAVDDEKGPQLFKVLLLRIDFHAYISWELLRVCVDRSCSCRRNVNVVRAVPAVSRGRLRFGGFALSHAKHRCSFAW